MSSPDQSLTHSLDEANIHEAIGAKCIFAVPYFQRSYSWGEKELAQLREDISAVINEDETVQFLGAMILYQRPAAAGQSMIYEVVDGQQRLATMTLLMCGMCKQFCDLEKFDEAAAIVESYLILPGRPRGQSNLKLHPGRHDRLQFNTIIQELMGNAGLRRMLGQQQVHYLPSSGDSAGKMQAQYRRILAWLGETRDIEGFDRLNDVYQAVMTQFTTVQILLRDPTTCSQIFERLNYRGRRVTTGDLVRNEIFAKVADHDPHEAEAVYNASWEPFSKRFTGDSSFENYFFPFALIHKPTVTKSDAFSFLRKEWRNESDPTEIVRSLERYQFAYLDISHGGNSLKLPANIDSAVRRLREGGAPRSSYPFLMQLLQSAAEGAIAEVDVVEILGLIESFFVRRAICGYEPTGLHAVFKTLWRDAIRDGGGANSKKVESLVRARKTVPWPEDQEFSRAITGRGIYGATITSYVLKEYDRSLGGDVPSDHPEIEHILPQVTNAAWREEFSAKEHKALCDTWANLIPVSSPHNKKLSAKPYRSKRDSYRKDSMYATPRAVAAEFSTWTPSDIRKRADALQVWALKRWPK